MRHIRRDTEDTAFVARCTRALVVSRVAVDGVRREEDQAVLALRQDARALPIQGDIGCIGAVHDAVKVEGPNGVILRLDVHHEHGVVFQTDAHGKVQPVLLRRHRDATVACDFDLRLRANPGVE